MDHLDVSVCDAAVCVHAMIWVTVCTLMHTLVHTSLLFSVRTLQLRNHSRAFSTTV